jgi:energy-coupling factor transporter ATP-binding protein EcfA2
MIESISVIGGRGKDGGSDSVARIDLHMGDVVSIVGPTGSGKTTLINDIELFADGDTPLRLVKTKRLEVRHFCFAACGSSIGQEVIAGTKSLDAPEPFCSWPAGLKILKKLVSAALINQFDVI